MTFIEEIKASFPMFAAIFAFCVFAAGLILAWLYVSNGQLWGFFGALVTVSIGVWILACYIASTVDY